MMAFQTKGVETAAITYREAVMIFLLKTRYLSLDARQKRTERSVKSCSGELRR